MDHIEKQFDDSRKQMDMDDTTLKKLAEASLPNCDAGGKAARRKQPVAKTSAELEAENAELRKQQTEVKHE